jgi:hypothetical protein
MTKCLCYQEATDSNTLKPISTAYLFAFVIQAACQTMPLKTASFLVFVYSSDFFRSECQKCEIDLPPSISYAILNYLVKDRLVDVSTSFPILLACPFALPLVIRQIFNFKAKIKMTFEIQFGQFCTKKVDSVDGL